jgi:Zn-dependent protease
MQALDIYAIVVPIAIVLLSLTVHEAAHAWTAERLGDPTARMLGRVSLNPLVHIDPIGTVLLPLLAARSNLPIIGWAKPVPVNITRLRRGRRDFMLVAAAGPASNIALAFIGGLMLTMLRPVDGLDAYDIITHAAIINIYLAVFNLIPVPPLDGGNVLAGLLPPSAAAIFDNLRPFGFVILYGMMFTGVLEAIITPLVAILVKVLIP